MSNNMRRLKEMLQQVVDDINKCLNESRWSEKQLAYGKNFLIHQDWLPLSSTLVKKYRAAGWLVKLNVEVEPGQRQYILNIKHPEASI
tara:strand:+ start:656 stop:919 length:264 start_codon:yes stop_codon:yes gene_type:complete